jgi:very-short-patch-repair endonuclease
MIEECILQEESTSKAKVQLQKVFSYIRELNKLRTPPTAKLSAYNWHLRFSSLPSFPTVQTNYIPDDEKIDFDGVLLRVKRPLETPCPALPKSIIDWVENGWEQIDNDPKHLTAKNKKDLNGQTVTENFSDDLERVKAYKLWIEKRDSWKKAERPAREAAKLFSDFFKLQGQLQRESEKYQLYLGEGHLVWQSAVEPIDHPVLLKKVELEFDSAVPEFIIRELDDSPELYTALLRFHELDGNAIISCKKQLEELEPHPLANGKTSEFLKFFVQRFFPNGRLYNSRNEIDNSSPAVYRDPVIFLGNRSQGFTEALDRLIDALPGIKDIPEALMRIVGIDEKISPKETGNLSDSDSLVPKNESKIDFLLTKPANKEQERVIKRLEETGSVLVQGPPGTGKSHTIANVIGHMLASGKTVLVSSHTSKSLKVVREKVVKPLQPLCVSVLENDLESKSQLEESINGIVSYLSRNDVSSINMEIEQLGVRRQEIRAQLEKLEQTALEIRKSEYTDVIVAGEGTPPSEAARKVFEMQDMHGWIPSPMQPGAPLPLSDLELMDLYTSNGLLSKQEELCLSEGLPDLSCALKPSEVLDLASDFNRTDLDHANRFSELWSNQNQDANELEKVLLNLKKSLDIFTSHKWIKKVVEDSKNGQERLQTWHKLIEIIETTSKEIGFRSELILKYGPQTKISPNLESISICKEIISHLEAGNSLGFFSTVLRKSWKSFISSCKVDEGTPSHIKHFEAILALLETHNLRRELVRRWERQVIAIGGPKLEEVEPEIHAKSNLEALRFASDWSASIWSKIEGQLSAQGYNLKAAYDKVTLTSEINSFTEQIQTLSENFLIPSIESRCKWIYLKLLRSRQENCIHLIKENLNNSSNAEMYLNKLLKSISSLHASDYEEAYNTYLMLKSKTSIFEKRQALLKKLALNAPGWSKAIEHRVGVHELNTLPGDPKTAWNVCQWRQELDFRSKLDYSTIQREVARLKTELNGINAQYVEKLAWKYQHARTGLKERQALTGWQQMQNRITRTGRGVRDLQLKREARKMLKECKNAVPVWIMPLSRVFDSFDLVATKFDVLLIDEASQSDITALVAFSIAKQVIVVGDDEQVTPYAVGQELGKVQTLIDEYLQGIPNHMLYVGKTSVYDLAAQAFGETIRLVEHFRCVPDIIEFSNQLSYGGEIRPLREASSSPYVSHLISHRIEGAISENKTNQKEAIEIASIVAAMIETPDYKNASIGVISMVGQEQAILIDGILQKRLPTNDYSKHNLLCGNASQFQGDERDVIIISMVDTCDSPPLHMRQSDDFKKIFNVAASRAKNQLWVVHSLNPSTDLKPGDLRLRLIKHAENPKELTTAIEAVQKKADPKSVVFEPMVIRDLMQQGFRITPQYEVGAYTIDMVVEGLSKRIAIECDGDRYHPAEKLADDIQRQLVLERLGWSFIRIRGSEYFRQRENTIKRIVSELESMGIEKLGPVTTEKSTITTDPLKFKIIQRAEEIKNSWNEDAVEEKEVKVKQGRWGKKISSNEKPLFDGNAALNIDPIDSQPVSQVESYQEKILEPKNRISTNNDWRLTIMNLDPNRIASFLTSHGFEVVDKRNVGGSLWVIDNERFKPLAEHLDSIGFKFIFATNGSGSTQGRPAWYTKAN